MQSTDSNVTNTMSSAHPALHESLCLPEEGGSQAVKAQQRLRELILQGELPAGARITELILVDMLGVSRTPIRAALKRLEQEGLLQALPSGGHAVRIFSEQDVADAIELRGTLEGLAARLAAERGVSSRALVEALMREHSRIARHNMQLALREPGALRVPGARLIRSESSVEEKHVH